MKYGYSLLLQLADNLPRYWLQDGATNGKYVDTFTTTLLAYLLAVASVTTTAIISVTTSYFFLLDCYLFLHSCCDVVLLADLKIQLYC